MQVIAGGGEPTRVLDGADDGTVRAVVAALGHKYSPKAPTSAIVARLGEIARPERVRSAQPAAAGARGDEVLFNRSARFNPGDTPIARDRFDRTVARITAQWKADGKASVRPVDWWTDLPAEVQEAAKEVGYDNASASERIPGVTWRGTVYLVHENLTNEKVLEETLFHERTHQVLRGNKADPGGVKLRQALQSLYNKLGGELGLRALARQAGVDIAQARKQADALHDAVLAQAKGRADAQQRATAARAVLMTEEFLADLEGARAYETLPQTLRRKFHEAVGLLRKWLHDNGFTRLARALGHGADTVDLADLRAMLHGIRQQAAGSGDEVVRFIRVQGDRNAAADDVRSLAAQYASADGAPTPAQIAAAVKQQRDTERAYGGREGYERAKAAGQTKLGFGQWVQARTPNFKRWFGDWEALRAQKRLDEMEPASVRVPDAWHGLSHVELRQKMAEALDRMVRERTEIKHPELGTIRIGRVGARKSENSARDPAKSLVAADIEALIPASIYARSEPQRGKDGQDVDGYGTLLARVDVAGVPLVAAFTVRHQSDGRWYYNAVTLHDAQEKARDSYGRPDRVPGSSDAPIAGLADFVRRPLARVNPAEVSAVTDSQTGEPMVVYHATDNDFSVFDSSRGGENTDRNASSEEWAQTARMGSWFSDRDVSVSTGQGVVMPAFLNIRNPKSQDSLQWLAERAIPLAGNALEYRKSLIADGYDGLVVQDEELGGVSYVTFNPEQIKSATGNVGTFDPENPNIAFSLPEESQVDAAARDSAAHPDAETPATPAQQEAGNHKMGHVSIHGLDVTIEVPKGVRSAGRRRADHAQCERPEHQGHARDGCDETRAQFRRDHQPGVPHPQPAARHAVGNGRLRRRLQPAAQDRRRLAFDGRGERDVPQAARERRRSAIRLAQ